MTDTARDALFARVFATPAGAELIADLRSRGQRFLTAAEIDLRVGRARQTWTIKAPSAPAQ